MYTTNIIKIRRQYCRNFKIFRCICFLSSTVSKYKWIWNDIWVKILRFITYFSIGGLSRPVSFYIVFSLCVRYIFFLSIFCQGYCTYNKESKYFVSVVNVSNFGVSIMCVYTTKSYWNLKRRYLLLMIFFLIVWINVKLISSMWFLSLSFFFLVIFFVNENCITYFLTESKLKRMITTRIAKWDLLKSCSLDFFRTQIQMFD